MDTERATEHSPCAVDHKTKKPGEIPVAYSLFSIDGQLDAILLVQSHCSYTQQSHCKH